MKIKVVRRWFGEDTTIDKVLINEKFFSYGLEDQVRPKGVKVAGETAIPYGTYPITIRYWDKVGRDVPQINDVPNFEGILIHPGTTATDTRGCLLVGYKKGNDGKSILDSRAAADELTRLIKVAIAKGEKVTIQFVNYEERAVKIILGLALIVSAIYLLKRFT